MAGVRRLPSATLMPSATLKRLPLSHDVMVVGMDIGVGAHGPVRPANPQRVHDHGLAEPRVDVRDTLGPPGRSRRDFPELPAAPRLEPDLRAVRLEVAARSIPEAQR